MIDSETLGQAVVIWTGWGRTGTPTWSDERVLEHFGDGLGRQLLPLLSQVVDDFYAAPKDLGDQLWEDGLSQAGRRAAARFRGLRPEISEDAVDALTWCFTYDYK